MKKLTLLFSALVKLLNLPVSGQTNDFYDDAPAAKLKAVRKSWSPEVEKEMTVDITKLPLHSITVKERR